MGYIGAEPATSFETVRKDRFTSQTGTTVTLSHTVSSINDIVVWVNSVKQDYTNYSVSGTTLTLGGSLVSADIVEVAYIGRTFQTVAPDTNMVTNAMMADDSIDSAEIVDGSVDTAHIGASQVTTAKIAADAIDGTKIADDAINSEHYTDGSIDTAHIADDQVTLAKMAGLARGKIIYGDASGNPAALTVGSNTQVLKSDGTDISWGADAGFDVSTITGATALAATPATTDEFILSDGGVLKRLDATHMMNRPIFIMSATGGNQTLTESSATKAEMQTAHIDTASGCDVSTNYRYTVQTGDAGTYYITYSVSLHAGDNDLEYIILFLKKNGGDICSSYTYYWTTHSYSRHWTFQQAALLALAEGDYLEVFAQVQVFGSTAPVLHQDSINKYGTHLGGFKIA